VVGLGLAFICLTISAEIGGKKGERSKKKVLTIETKMVREYFFEKIS